MFRHLTHTGYDAGKPICGTALSDKTDNDVHAMYAPLANVDFRATVCPHCLKAWADTYDADELHDAPLWVQVFHNYKG